MKKPETKSESGFLRLFSSTVVIQFNNECNECFFLKKEEESIFEEYKNDKKELVFLGMIETWNDLSISGYDYINYSILRSAPGLYHVYKIRDEAEFLILQKEIYDKYCFRLVPFGSNT